MGSSFRDNLYQWPNFAIMGTEIPERLIRRRPAWTDNPPIVPPADPDNPYGDPPHFHDVDPPARNPYNDPNYSPFIATEKLSAKASDGLGGGGLLGMLLRALMQQGRVQPGLDSVSTANGASEFNSADYGSPQGLLGRLLALHNERARNAVDLYRNDGAGGGRVARTYATPPQEFPTTPQKPVRILSRRLAG
jgi:hypothetical protein